MADVVATTPTDAAADPAHPDHARWVKDTLWEDQCNYLRSIGAAEVNATEIERELVSNIRRVTNRERDDGKRKRWRQRNTRNERNAQRMRVSRDRMENRFRKSQSLLELRESVSCPCKGNWADCPRCKLERRIYQIVELDPGKPRPPRLSLHDYAEYCKHPKYARQVFRVYTDKVSFAGDFARFRCVKVTSDVQKTINKIVNRKLMDVADRSSGSPPVGLGSWR